MKNKNLLFMIIPVIILIGWAGYHEIHSNIGNTVYLKIRGFDPRDLLSGHYLTYEVEYENFSPSECRDNSNYADVDYLCLDTGEINTNIDACKVKIQGECSWRGFDAGINRFYIPQEYALKLDNLLRNGEYPATIEVLVNSSGRAYVKELFFDNIPWKTFIMNSDTVEQSSESIDTAVDVENSGDVLNPSQSSANPEQQAEQTTEDEMSTGY